MSSNESFWNGTVCTPAFSFNKTCSDTYMCKTLTEGTFCDGSCVCSAAHYYNSSISKCVTEINCPQVLNNETYWDGLQCAPSGTYGGKCTSNKQCQILTQLLKCETSTMTCSCSKSYWNFPDKFGTRELIPGRNPTGNKIKINIT